MAFLSIFWDNQSMFILGTKVDKLSKNEAVARLALFLDDPRQRFITTPNPEIILYARRHPAYREILNKSDLAVPDGAGLLLAARLGGQALPERVSGSDLLPEICRLAREKRLKVALLGGLDQRAIEKAASTLRAWGNEVVYANHGVIKKEWNNAELHDKITQELRAANPDLVFVGFGHPKQEEWIERYRAALPSVRLFIGCGGALDFVAGTAKRAPRWMRPWFEWLWRLIIEPRRAKRIFNAVIVFPATVIYESFKKK